MVSSRSEKSSVSLASHAVSSLRRRPSGKSSIPLVISPTARGLSEIALPTEVADGFVDDWNRPRDLRPRLRR